MRFMPPAVADLILTFVALVQPLRLVFRQEAEPKPEAASSLALSPFLFSKLDGSMAGRDGVEVPWPRLRPRRGARV